MEFKMTKYKYSRKYWMQFVSEGRQRLKKQGLMEQYFDIENFRTMLLAKKESK